MMMNFKQFLIEAGGDGPIFTTSDGHREKESNQQELPDTLLDFPTITKTAPVLSCRVVGKNYCIQLQGEATIYIECSKFHQLFGKRLPKPGEIMTAVWYKFKDNDEKNYKLQSIKLSGAA